MIGTNVGQIYYSVTADTGELIDQTRVVERETERMAASFNAITRAVKVLATALAAMKIVQLADEFRLLAARVEVAAGSVERGAEAMRELEAISARTMTSVAGNAEVFQRLNQSLLQMGGTQADTLRVTELLAKAIKVSGASAVEAKAAMLQFGQALGSGKLAGDELRSLMETAPYLMRQLADGIGVPVGSLKKLGEEGKLTADVVVNALGKAAAKISDDFAKFPQTFDAAFSALENAAMKASKALDDTTGASAALTGITKGLADGVESLAMQMMGVSGEADNLGRNKAIDDWSRRALTAFSYVADAADMVRQTLQVLYRNVEFTFVTMGDTIASYVAVSKKMLSGDIEGAKELGRAYRVAAEARRNLLDYEDGKTLNGGMLAGQRIRQRMEAMKDNPGPNPLDQRLAAGKPSKLKGTPDDKGKGGSKFDAVGYLLDLESKTKTAYERIDAIETEALHKADELRKAGKISAKQYEEAKTLIQAQAAQERAALADADRQEQVKRQAEFEAAGIAQDKRNAEDRARGQALARDAIGDADPVAKLQLELQAKSALLAEFAAKDQDNLELYAKARVALEQETDRKIREIRQKEAEERQRQQSQMLQNYGGLFGSLADMAKAYGGEQSKTYRALFAVSKAFALADSVIKIQQGIANASTLPFPANLGAMATVAAQTASIVSTIKSTNFGGGRQYGGPVTAGSLYRVNETGRPEMFTAANGSQYMMPTASGSVTPADKVGGGAVNVQVVVHNNHPTAQVTASRDASGNIAVAVNEVASQIAERRGPVWGALRSTNVQGRVS